MDYYSGSTSPGGLFGFIFGIISNLSPGILALLGFVTFVILLVFTSFLIYHWRHYSLDSDKMRSILTIHFVIGIILVLVMFASFFAYISSLKNNLYY